MAVSLKTYISLPETSEVKVKSVREINEGTCKSVSQQENFH